MSVKLASEKQIAYIMNLISKLATRKNHVESELIRRIEIRENLTSKEASQVIEILQTGVPEWVFGAIDKNRKVAPLFGQRVVDFLTRIDEIRSKGLIYKSPDAIINAIDNPQLEESEGVATQEEVAAYRAGLEARRLENERRFKVKAQRKAYRQQRYQERKVEIDEALNHTDRVRQATQGMHKVAEQYELGSVLFSGNNETIYAANVAGFDGIVVMRGERAIVYAPENAGLKKVLFS